MSASWTSVKGYSTVYVIYGSYSWLPPAPPRKSGNLYGVIPLVIGTGSPYGNVPVRDGNVVCPVVSSLDTTRAYA